MSDATDDLDYQESDLADKFQRIDKELWDKQMKRRTSDSQRATQEAGRTTGLSDSKPEAVKELE